MRRQRQLNTFGQALDETLADLGVSNDDFCRKTGVNRSTLSNLKLRPPTNAPTRPEVEAWGTALGLTTKQNNALYDAAQLAFSPRYVQDLVARLRRKESRAD